MEREKLNKIWSQVLEVLGRRVDLKRCLVLLYGSTALGEDTELSDIDLAIDCLEPLEDGLFLELLEELNLHIDTPKRLELVELCRLSDEFLESLLKGAVLWHVGKDYLKNWLKRSD